MRVTIPSDAEIGQVYSIGLRFRESAGKKSGESVQTVGGMTNSIEVVVGKRIEESKRTVEEEITPVQTAEQPRETIITETLKKGYSKTPLIILFILVISIIIFFRYESRKKNI